MRSFVAIIVLAIGMVACGTAAAGEVERLALWPGLEDWLKGEGQGFIVPTVETTDWVGFVSEGDRVCGLDTGHSFRYVFDREGTFYLGVIMTDDPDGVERLRVTLKDHEVGTILGRDENGKALYSLAEPVTVKKGDALDFTCMTPVGCYRIYDLVFAKKRILPPQPAFNFIETRCTAPGAVDVCWTTSGIVSTGRLEYRAQGGARKSGTDNSEGRNHRIRLEGLNTAAEYTARILTSWQGKELASRPFSFKAAPEQKIVTKRQSIALTVAEPTAAPRKAWPTTVGVPFRRGSLANAADLALVSPQGKGVSLQAAVSSRWDDGSVKWAAVSFLADSGADKRYHLEAKPDGGKNQNEAAAVLAIAESPKGWGLSTGAMSFTIAKEGPAFFGRYGFDRNGDGVIGAAEVTSGSKTAGLMLETEDGAILTCGAPGSVEIEENGPVRAIVECAGAMSGQGWRYLVRLTFWKGMPGMAVNVTVWNGEEKPLFRKVRRLAVKVPLAEGAVRPEDAVHIVQDTDSHYTQTRGASKTEGERARGLVTARAGEGAVSLLVRDFWQTYPSGLALGQDCIQIDLLPALAPDAYTVAAEGSWFYRIYQWFDEGCYLMRAGQSTQHEFYLWFDGKGDPAQRAAWFERPVLPQASPEYLCGTGVLGGGLYPRTPGVFDKYEAAFDTGYTALEELRKNNRMYGWMNFGDWYGERGYNAGNNEYDLAWATGMQWMRTADRQLFDRGLEMARHYATVDTIRGTWTESLPGIVWEHSFNHVGTRRSVEALGFDDNAKNYAVSQPGTFEGGMDPQGHIFEDGVWLYGLLTGDSFLLNTAERVCTRQADFLTPTFDFEIERGGGWPLINATGAYMFTGDPYYLNAARIMVQRCLERHDPEHGGWPHVPPLNETEGKPVWGGKAFATGVLTYGLLRYLDVEPLDRPDVERMLLNTADWLMTESWEAGNGFKYITNSPKHIGKGHRGHECVMNADVIGFAYEATGDKKYLDFWEEMMAGAFDHPISAWGKGFSQGTRQTVFGLDRARKAGVTACKPLPKK